MDRGYGGLKLFLTLLDLKIDFCIRLNSAWSRFARMKNSQEKIMRFRRKGDKRRRPRLDKVHPVVTLRIIKVKLPNGDTKILATSVLDSSKIPYEAFADLYHQRWGIEENYKLLKNVFCSTCFRVKHLLQLGRIFTSRCF